MEERWYSASCGDVAGSIRIVSSQVPPFPPGPPMPYFQWLSHDGTKQYRIPLDPTQPIDVFVGRKPGSAKMKLVANVPPDPGPVTMVFDFFSLEERDVVAGLLKAPSKVPPAPLAPPVLGIPTSSSSEALVGQQLGLSSQSVLSTVTYNVVQGRPQDLTTTITPQFIRDVFGQFPAALAAYKDTVLRDPPTMSEQAFWSAFLCSPLFTNASRGGLFEKYEEEFQAAKKRATYKDPHDPSLRIDRKDVETTPSPGYGTRSLALTTHPFELDKGRVVNHHDDEPSLEDVLRPHLDLSHAIIAAAAPKQTNYTDGPAPRVFGFDEEGLVVLSAVSRRQDGNPKQPRRSSEKRDLCAASVLNSLQKMMDPSYDLGRAIYDTVCAMPPLSLPRSQLPAPQVPEQSAANISEHENDLIQRVVNSTRQAWCNPTSTSTTTDTSSLDGLLREINDSKKKASLPSSVWYHYEKMLDGAKIAGKRLRMD